MTKKRHPDALTIHERRKLKALFGQGKLTNDQIAKDLGLRTSAVTRFRRSVEAESARGTALTKTPLDYTVWRLSQQETLTETQEKFLLIYQSETLAIWKRDWRKKTPTERYFRLPENYLAKRIENGQKKGRDKKNGDTERGD